VKKLFLLCVFLIAYFSLYPWRIVSSQEPATILHGFEPFVGRSAYLDVAVNFFFYLPLGILGVLAWRGDDERRWWRWVALTAGGAALSLVLETMQAWVPGRDSTVQDVVINTVGTMAGVCLGLTLAARLPADSVSGPWSSVRPMPVVLVTAWLVAQWFPFLPILRVRAFQASLAQLTQVSPFPWLDSAETFVSCLLVSRLLRAFLTKSMWRVALVGACLVLPARLFLAVGSAPWPLTAAAVCALLLSGLVLSRFGGEAWLLAVMAVLLIAVKELYPFHFVDAPGPFYWIPFTGFLGATRDAAIRVTSGKFFLYGVTVWMLREAGLPLWASAASVTSVLFVGEVSQRYLPGHVAESTDVLLVLLATVAILWLHDRQHHVPSD
jgi:VanZ family protein